MPNRQALLQIGNAAFQVIAAKAEKTEKQRAKKNVERAIGTRFEHVRITTPTIPIH